MSCAQYLQDHDLFYNKPEAHAFSLMLQLEYKLSLLRSIVEGSHRLDSYDVVSFYISL